MSLMGEIKGRVTSVPAPLMGAGLPEGRRLVTLNEVLV